MNKNRLSIYLPLLLSLILIIGILIGIQFKGANRNFLKIFSTKQEKFQEVLNYVGHNYVDTVNEDMLKEKAISGMLQSLDPHSVYISSSEFHEAVDPLLGSFEGIGVQFRIDLDSITVITPVSGGPSEKVGIRAGDRIVKVDGVNMTGKKLTNTDVMHKLKGPRGTKVKVSIFRRGVPGLTDYTIVRDYIPTYSLDISYMPASGIGYIKLNTFSATTHEETEKALKDLNSKGLKKLILDLRGNGGGYLQAAIDVADEFLTDKKLIVYTKGLHHPKEVFNASSGGLFETGDLVVLIDEYSASASEIVAGAIQDNDRGTIIGHRSYGKGLVQEQMNLKDGSAVRLTVARYYTPTGRCIQRPYKSGTDEYNLEYFHRLQNGDPESADTTHPADSLKFKTPGGKVVYGGGGITPDLFVPAEKDSTLIFYNTLANKGLIYQFAFDYTDKYRKDLSRNKTYLEFDRNFQVTPAIFGELIRYGEKNGVKRKGKESASSDEHIKTLLKAYIGRNILDNNGFYPFLNRIDPGFAKAMNFLGK